MIASHTQLKFKEMRCQTCWWRWVKDGLHFFLFQPAKHGVFVLFFHTDDCFVRILSWDVRRWDVGLVKVSERHHGHIFLCQIWCFCFVLVFLMLMIASFTELRLEETRCQRCEGEWMTAKHFLVSTGVFNLVFSLCFYFLNFVDASVLGVWDWMLSVWKLHLNYFSWP